MSNLNTQISSTGSIAASLIPCRGMTASLITGCTAGAGGGSGSSGNEPVSVVYAFGGGNNDYTQYYDPQDATDPFDQTDIYISGFDGDDGSHLHARVSTNGTSLRTDATGYSYASRFMDGGNTNLNNNTSDWRLYNITGAVGNERQHGIVKLYNQNSARISTSGTGLFGGQHNDASSRAVYGGFEFSGETNAQYNQGFSIYSAGGSPDGGRARGWRNKRS